MKKLKLLYVIIFAMNSNIFAQYYNNDFFYSKNSFVFINQKYLKDSITKSDQVFFLQTKTEPKKNIINKIKYELKNGNELIIFKLGDTNFIFQELNSLELKYQGTLKIDKNNIIYLKDTFIIVSSVGDDSLIINIDTINNVILNGMFNHNLGNCRYEIGNYNNNLKNGIWQKIDTSTEEIPVLEERFYEMGKLIYEKQNDSSLKIENYSNIVFGKWYLYQDLTNEFKRKNDIIIAYKKRLYNIKKRDFGLLVFKNQEDYVYFENEHFPFDEIKVENIRKFKKCRIKDDKKINLNEINYEIIFINAEIIILKKYH